MPLDETGCRFLQRLAVLLSEILYERLDAFRREYDALTAEYLTDNQVRQDYLLTRAIKA